MNSGIQELWELMILNLEVWVPLVLSILLQPSTPISATQSPPKDSPRALYGNIIFFFFFWTAQHLFFPSPRFSILIVLRDAQFAFSFNFSRFKVDRLPTKAQRIRANEKFNSKNFVRIFKKRHFCRSCRKSWYKPKVQTGILSENQHKAK